MREIAELKARCGPKDAVGAATAGRFVLDLALPLASDSTTFCTFRDGNVVFTPVFVTPDSGPVTTPAETPQPSSPPTREPPTAPPPLGGTPSGEVDPCEQLRRLRQERAELLRIQQLIAKARESGAPIDADVASKSILRAEEIQLEEARLVDLCNPPPETPAATPPPIDPEDPVDELPPRAPPAQPPLAGGVPTGESDPCEQLRRVREEQEELRKIRILIEQASAASAPLDAEVVRRTYNRTDELRLEEARLVKLCKPPNLPGPAPSPTDPEDPISETPPALPSNIFVKATSNALDQGARAQETAGQVIRLFAPEQIDVALPTPGGGEQQAQRSQQGHDSDPLQAVTDSNGDAQLTAGLLDFFGNPDPTHHGGFDIEVTIDVTGHTSINLIAPRDSAILQDTLAGFGLDDYTVGVDQIGDYQVGTLVYPTDLDELIRGYIEHALPGAQVEDNLCRIKEPAAVTEYHACKLGERAPPPGARLLTPPDPREGLPGAALSLNESADWGQP
ncbi:hypothetical protein [Qipengyuania sp. ASV99]|uniref:hypothetical protein n=1 Tax=Qipengyuania sp. ASV99 TaxID=3399681 RepID=UPI003A4C5CA4